MRNVLKLGKLMGKPAIEPMSDDSVPFLIDSSASKAAASRSASAKNQPVREKSAQNAPKAPNARAPEPAAAPLAPSRLSRAEALKSTLDVTLDRVQHARNDADQLYALIADLESEAREVSAIAARNEDLAQSLDAERAETAALNEKAAELERELSRAKDDCARSRTAAEDAQKETSALLLANQREADKRTALSAEMSQLRAELETAREANSKAEVDNASLRNNLDERERALRALQLKESELRLKAEKDAGLIAEMAQNAERKERKILELGAALEKGANRIEELEERGERISEEHRALEIRHSDLQISSESRAFALSGSLDQEKAGHRVTRKLLEEMRVSSQSLADENKQVKEQSLALAQENQQMKHELGGTRGTIREYGERLAELNLRYSAAQDDIERLENIIADGKKEARGLKRRASKVDELISENASLHDKIKSLQHTVDQYRAASDLNAQSTSDAPIILPARRVSSRKAEPESKAATSVAKLPRAQ